MLWTCWGEDWTARAIPESVHRTVTADLDGGGTILLHDSDCTSAPGAWRSALGALPRILDTCTERGYEVGPLCDHGQPLPDTSCGNPLQPPIVYSYVDDRLWRSRSFLSAHRRQGMTARRMHLALESDPDRKAVLARFVDRLPATDVELLRQPLGSLPDER
ncbi:hypothetical protein [Streptomyces sp. NPDC090798]|uniref:hypothetical protein n=1 Tax=Streptomyces sp. NPDC090798 TaxID=3365968 RepID=UPI00380D968D